MLAAEQRSSDYLVAHILRLSGDARRGMADLVLELEGRSALPSDPAAAWFDLPIGQRQLSAVLGLSTAHVNKTLADLRLEGLIEIRPRGMRVVDRAGLQRLAFG